ncbi:glutathione S-transferase family protein [Kordiimonas marina]|uniref:glutathione S-transferase family protein n=1 Tax=Kordiimonas marina TaxID=2872312 RepID=UPI001FF319DB|nr:glutathione S-transferase family protein [Kordiimonas marina]MCJ9428413.1 glutathione S-transferase family protein [Kordiimonas marina]
MTDLTIITGTKTYSSWSLRGWLAVTHTGLEFSEINLPLDTPEFHERIKTLSPSGFVPALQHGDVKVWDSLAIIDYCARLAPGRFWWPDEMAAYGFARSIVAEMHSGFMALRAAAPMNLRDQRHGLTLSDAVQKNVSRIDALWAEARERFGAGGDFLFGGFSAADMMYAPVVARFLSYGIGLSKTASAYRDAVRAYPFVNAWYEAAAKETQVVTQDEIAPDATHLG